jgi:hypothetical protein
MTENGAERLTRRPWHTPILTTIDLAQTRNGGGSTADGNGTFQTIIKGP